MYTSRLRASGIKLVKYGARIVSHSRMTVFQMAEVAVPEELFRRESASGGYNDSVGGWTWEMSGHSKVLRARGGDPAKEDGGAANR